MAEIDKSNQMLKFMDLIIVLVLTAGCSLSQTTPTTSDKVTLSAPELTISTTPASEQSIIEIQETPTVGYKEQPTLLPSITGTPVPETPFTRVDIYQNIYYDQIPDALAMMLSSRYSESILVWDEVIEALPDYSYAYFQRARSKLLLSQDNPVPEEARKILEAALKDSELSLELGPETGSHYHLRYEIYRQFARLAKNRDERLAWLELALDEIRMANSLINRDSGYLLSPGYVLIELGRCQEAMDEFAGLIDTEQNRVRLGELNLGIAGSYMCFSQLEPALVHITLAEDLQPGWTGYMIKATTLYHLGELKEALELLGEWIASQPDGPPDRFFLKALIHYELGIFDLAHEDLETGAAQVSELRGVGAYIAGLLAIQDGEPVRGQELLQYAAQTLSFGYAPLLNQIYRDLGLPQVEFSQPVIPSINIPTLTAMPSYLTTRFSEPTSSVTVMPTLSQTITSTATLSPTAATATKPSTPEALPPGASLTPTYSPSLTRTELPTSTPTEKPTPTETPLPGVACNAGQLFISRDLLVPSEGTGPFQLGTQPGGLTFYFAPEKPLEFERIEALTLELSPSYSSEEADLQVVLFRYSSPEYFEGSPGIELSWGKTRYEPPPGYVFCNGGLYVRVINRSGRPIGVENLQLTVDGEF